MFRSTIRRNDFEHHLVFNVAVILPLSNRVPVNGIGIHSSQRQRGGFEQGSEYVRINSFDANGVQLIAKYEENRREGSHFEATLCPNRQCFSRHAAGLDRR